MSYDGLHSHYHHISNRPGSAGRAALTRADTQTRQRHHPHGPQNSRHDHEAEGKRGERGSQANSHLDSMTPSALSCGAMKTIPDDARLTVRLSKSLHRRLKVRAARNGEKVNDILNALIADYLRNGSKCLDSKTAPD